MQDYKATNNAKGLLEAGISAGSTTILLQTGQGALFPSTFPFKLKIEQFNTEGQVIKREIATCTNRVGDALTVSRATENCPTSDANLVQEAIAFQFSRGDQVAQVLTAGHISDIQDEIKTKLAIADYQNGTKVYGSSSTGGDSYAITLSPAPSAYITGMCFRFQADVSNTGAATMNVNGLGAKTIKKQHDRDLETGDIEAGQIVTVTYDGTNFQMDSQVATIPTVNIHGETDIWTDIDITADEFMLYDSSAGANRKSTIGRLKASDAEAQAGVIESKFLVPKQAKDLYGANIIAGTTYTSASAPTTRTTTSATPVKIKEITIKSAGTYTVSFTLQAPWVWSGRNNFGQVYKNGVAFGSSQILSNTSSDATFTENLSFASGDKCQLYVWNNQGLSYGAYNFLVKYSIELIKGISTVDID